MSETPTLKEMGVLDLEGEQALIDLEQQMKGVVQAPDDRYPQKSKLITYDGKPLPERWPVWRADDGREVLLPTGALRYHLRKRTPAGKPVFVTKKPEIAQKVPIDQACEICVRMNGASRKFYSDPQYQDHMEILHPREWERAKRDQESTQRDLEFAQRREELAILRTLAEKGNVNVTFTCDTCGKTAKSEFGLRAHQRSHLSGVRK